MGGESQRVVEVRVPAHITGFFSPSYGPDPLRTGSVGAGLVLSPGVICRAYPDRENRLLLNGEACSIRPALTLARQTRGLSYELESSLHIGAGYAVSASSSLAVGVAGSLHRGGDMLSAAREAHIAEVICRTGLGDVLALYGGGELVYRSAPGAPGIGAAENIPVGGGTVIVASELGYMDTSYMLSRYGDRIKRYGDEAVRRFEKEKTFERFLELSEFFARGVGFYTDEIAEKLRPVRAKIDGASVKKRVLFAAVDSGAAEEVAAYLRSVFGSARILRIGGEIWRREYREAILDTSH